MSWIDDNKSEIAEAEWEGLDNKRSTRDSPKAWKLEEYREYSDLSHRKYALRNGLNPDEQVRYNKLSLHFEMFDNRHLVFDAYDTLKAKHERVIEAHDFQVKLNKELQNLLKQAQPEVEKLNSQLEIAKSALQEILQDTLGAETTMEANAYYLADDALAQIESLK